MVATGHKKKKTGKKAAKKKAAAEGKVGARPIGTGSVTADCRAHTHTVAAIPQCHGLYTI